MHCLVQVPGDLDAAVLEVVGVNLLHGANAQVDAVGAAAFAGVCYGCLSGLALIVDADSLATLSSNAAREGVR